MTQKTSKTTAAKKTKSPAAKTEKAQTKTGKPATSNYLDFVKLMTPTPLNNALEEKMAKSTNQFETFTKDATTTSREYFDAMTKSYSILTKGYESIIRTSVELSQTTAEKQAAYAKEALACKTINELTEIQNKIAQANFDDFMSGMTKMSEISTKVLTESAEPLNEQVNKAVQTMSKAAA